MSYTKNIAVIKGLKDGFSADGGPLSGLVKTEKYSHNLKVEIKLINFAPLTEGRYVAAISDGAHIEIIENCFFEGQSELDSGAGFAAVICYVNGGVRLIASAVCGNLQSAVLGLKGEIEKAEKIKPEDSTAGAIAENGEKEEQAEENFAGKIGYEDEAIAEENYYEFGEADESREPLCKNTQEEKSGCELYENEKASGAFEESAGGLARGGFYDRMKEETEKLFSSYPRCEELENAVEGSQWVKISYGEKNFYVFGVLKSAGIPRYLCYGLPSNDSSAPPESMRGYASFLPVEADAWAGFWIMYQDADTGASIKISNV